MIWTVIGLGLIAPAVLSWVYQPENSDWSILEAAVYQIYKLVANHCSIWTIRLLSRVFLYPLQWLFFHYSSKESGRVKGCWYGDKKNATENQNLIVLHIHGGGFVTGFPEQYALSYYSKLISQLKSLFQGRKAIQLFALQYDLAPENSFPIPIHQCKQAYEWLIEEKGYKPHEIVMSGDSAGANLLFACLNMLLEEEKQHLLPLCAILISPCLDMTLTSHWSQNHDCPSDILTSKTVKHWSQLYLNGADPKQVLASPALFPFRNLLKLVPMMMVGTKMELLFEDIEQFVKKIQNDDEVAKRVFFPNPHPTLFHDFCLLTIGQAATNCINQIAGFIHAEDSNCRLL